MSPRHEILFAIEDYLRERPDRWHVYVRSSKKADFIPRQWYELLRDCLSPGGEVVETIIRFFFYCRNGRLRLYLELGPCGDRSLANRLLDRVLNDRDEFGFRGEAKRRPESWTRLFSTNVLAWPEDSPPDHMTIRGAIDSVLEKTESRLAELPHALSPILHERHS